MIEDSLPKGWQSVRLGEICLINPSKSEIRDWRGDTRVTFVPMSAVDEEKGTITAPETRTLEEVKKGYTFFTEGDVLFAKITPCMQNGKSAIAKNLANGLGFGSTEFHVLRPRNGVLSEWIFYFVRQKWFRKLAAANFTGSVGQQRVPQSFFEERIIPVPPLEEQKRIVARIEKLMHRINQAKSLRQESAEGVALVLPSALHEIFAEATEREWETKRIDDVVEATETRDPRKWPDLQFVYIDINSIDNGTGTIREPKVLLGRNAPSRARKVVRTEDVIFSTTRPYLKGVALITQDFDNQICSTGFCVLRSKRDSVEPKWLLYMCRSDDVVNRISGHMRGASYPAVTDKDVRGVEIPVPSLEEQRRIVAYLDRLQAQVSELQRLQSETNKELESLTQSILTKAFRGEL